MHSIAFEFGSFTIYRYGVLTAAGFLAAIWTASRRAPAEGISADAIIGLAPWLIGGAVFGARLLYVATHWEEDFAGRPVWEIFKIRSGLVFYGGLVGASLGAIIYCRRHKLPLWKVADVLAPSVALGHAFGRMGCLMTGCCYGRACSLPWAIEFPKDHATAGVAVHPTQVYEASLNLALFFGLTWLYPRKKFDGQIFSIYLVAYALLRGFVEFFRGDYSTYHFGWITPAQWISLFILLVGMGLFWKLRVTRRRVDANEVR